MSPQIDNIQRRLKINLTENQRRVLCNELTGCNEVRTAQLLATLTSWDQEDQAAENKAKKALPPGGFYVGE
jgi:hypothetical protein